MTHDAAALQWLDRLLDLGEAEQHPLLLQLQFEHPVLHARVCQLLRAAEAADATDASATLFAPIAAAPASASPDRHAPNDEIGGYRLVRELGHGGMSTVWLAERIDQSVKRQVAIKMPLRVLESASKRERFDRERDVLAALAHPHIARLYDAGVAASGQPFIVLEYVRGLSIDRYCDAHKLPLRARIELFLQVLAAVADAHAHLVVHRDLKPSNIMVDEQGQVKLLDFGIAKLLSSAGLDETGDLTQVDGPVLTPRYAAPEQLRGGTISTSTDVYALGTVLYELLTGAHPFGGGTTAIGQVVDAVLREEPTRPSSAITAASAEVAVARSASSPARLGADLKGDLDTIVLKALRKQPQERYRTVEACADDLSHYLAHKPIAARQPSLFYLLRLFVRRHVAAVVVSAVGLAGVAVFAGMAWHQYQLSQESHAHTEAVRDFMFDMFGDAEPDEAHPGTEVSAKQLLSSAIDRARRDFADRPVLQGELLKELWRAQDRLGAADEQASLLKDALALLQKNAPPDDPFLNDTRYLLAEQAYMHGKGDEARMLALATVQSCTRSDARCAKVRGYAHDLLGRLAYNTGDTAAVREQVQQSVADLARGFGPNHVEVALAKVRQAVALRNIGQLLEAAQVLEEAKRLAATKRLAAADRIELRRVGAVIDLDLGKYEAAAAEFERLIPLSTLAADRALHWRLLAQTQLAQGLPAQAEASARAAAQATGPGVAPVEKWIVQQTLARAQALGASTPNTVLEMDKVVAGLLQTSSPTAIAPLRARRLHAEALIRQHEVAAARDELLAVEGAQAKAGSSQALERAQSLDLLGVALRLEERHAEAAKAHEQARLLMEAALPAEHPLLARNALYLQLARVVAVGSPQPDQALLDAAQRYAERFPADSRWRSVISQCLKEWGQPAGTCVWLL